MEIQNEEKAKTCSLCLELCNQNFEVVNDFTRQMLETVQLNPDIPISSDREICSSCTRNLEKCYFFRWSCLDTEDRIKSFASTSENAEVDLIEFHSSKSKYQNKASASKDHSVCRLCIKLIKHSRYVVLNKDTKVVTSLKVSLNKYFPELNLNITRDPVLCTACHLSLQEYIRFMDNCSGGKDTINQCKVERSISEHQPGDLSVTHFLTDVPVKCENDTSDNILDCNLVSGNTKIMLKHEDSACVKADDLNIKKEVVENEEVDIKMEENGNARNTEKTQDVHRHEPLTYQTKNDLKPDLSANTDATTYQCNLCSYKTKDKHKLRDHSRNHRDDIYYCQLCKYKTKRTHDLTRHMLVHQTSSEVTMYKCETCSFATKHKKNLKIHQRVHLNSDVLYKCEVCHFETTNEKRFNTHRSSHEALYECEVCSYKTKRRHDLRKHLLTHQDSSEVTMYQCEVCDFETKHKNNMKKHVMLQRHSCKYKCQICGHKSRCKDGLEAHVLVHVGECKEIRYHCHVCRAEFKCRSSLKGHLKLVHGKDITLHKCELCNFKTKYKHNLKKHMQVHSKPASRGIVKEYRCESCEFITRQERFLKSHMLTHRPATVYRCDVCKFQTKRMHCLKQHVRVHRD